MKAADFNRDLGRTKTETNIIVFTLRSNELNPLTLLTAARAALTRGCGFDPLNLTECEEEEKRIIY